MFIISASVLVLILSFVYCIYYSGALIALQDMDLAGQFNIYFIQFVVFSSRLVEVIMNLDLCQ